MSSNITVNSVSEEKINKFLNDTELNYPEYKVNSLGILYYELLDKIGKLGHKSLSIKGERYVLPGFEKYLRGSLHTTPYPKLQARFLYSLRK